MAQREMVEESQGQGGLDGKIRVPSLPASPAAPAGRPGRDRFRGQPQCHIAATNEGPVVGRPVRNAIIRLVRGMDLRLHPCSVAPAETRRAGQTAPPADLHATTPRGGGRCDPAVPGPARTLARGPRDVTGPCPLCRRRNTLAPALLRESCRMPQRAIRSAPGPGA